MKWFLSLFVALVFFTSGPSNAQEVRMGLLNNPLDWIVSQWDGRSGKAADGTGLLRYARDGSRAYGQRAKRGVLTNDVDQITSNRLWNPNGFNEIFGRVKDARDEGPAMVQVFSLQGDEIFRKEWAYKGHRTNGDWRRWSFAPNNRDILNGSRIVYTFDEKPNGNKNGAVVYTGVEVAAEPSCVTAQRARLSNMPSINDIRGSNKDEGKKGGGKNKGDRGKGRNK